MTRSRRLLYQAAVVCGLAAISAARARPVAAGVSAATAAFCTGNGLPPLCTDDCGAVWLSIQCNDCGGDAFPYCRDDIWDCPAYAPYRFGCEWAT